MQMVLSIFPVMETGRETQREKEGEREGLLVAKRRGEKEVEA